MCAVDDCEPWLIYTETQPTARKTHPCVECRRLINPGERYYRIEGLLDSGFTTYKVCRHCESVGDFMRVLCNGWPFGSLYHELVDHWREGYASIPLGRLIVAMRRRWRDGADPVPTGCGAMARELMQKAVAA